MVPPLLEGGDVGSTPFISVIIPHYNDLEALAVCYGRLRRQTWPAERFEIVIADNMSACGLAAVRQAAPSAIVVLAEIQGAGPARNAGVSASRGEILAFLDSDCVPGDDWLAQGNSALSFWDFVGGRVTCFARDPDNPSPVESFEIVFNFNIRRYVERVGFAGTGNMFLPRRVFEQVGQFRNGVSEDMDWSFRARAMGFRLGYAPEAVVGHPARADWTELKKHTPCGRSSDLAAPRLSDERCRCRSPYYPTPCKSSCLTGCAAPVRNSGRSVFSSACACGGWSR